MVYEFAAKVKNIKNDDMLDVNALDGAMVEMVAKKGKPMEFKSALIDTMGGRDMLIKAKVSIASLSPLHDIEFDEMLNNIRSYLEEISFICNGELSKAEAFYNNSKTFGKLF